MDFDSSVIETLKSIGGDEAAELVSELITTFIDTSLPIINDMKAALAESNFETLSQRAHTLKSSAGNVGAVKLSSLSESIEYDVEQSKISDPAHFAPMVDEIVLQYENAVTELKKVQGNE